MNSVLSPYQQQGHLPARRTNSLAFAKSDCHTCAALGLHCGRQRPRCGVCQDAGRLCQGYSMQLTWQQNHSAANKPPKVRARTPCASNGTTIQPVEKGKAKTKEYTFITGKAAKRRKHHHVSEEALNRTESCSISGQSDLDTLRSPEVPIIPCPSPAFANHVADVPSGTRSEWQHPYLKVSTIPEVQYPHSPDAESLEQCLYIQQYNDSPATWGQSTPGSTTSSWSQSGSLSEPEYAQQRCLAWIPQMCFATLHDKFSGLLNMCMSAFLPSGPG